MTNPHLLAQASQFKKEVIRLCDGVWSAVGFAASNVHMIEGEKSVTIIDTTESTQAAQNILTEFKKLTDKPIKRIIYTHSHRDHISGATVFSENDTHIYASYLFQSDLIDVDPNLIMPQKALGRRTLAQFGIGLTPEERVSLGVGPGDRPIKGLGEGFLKPTEIIEEDCDIELDGVPARLIHAPGETADHMMVWLPERKILFSGDNWYHAFPNLYAIRGTPYRDFAKWAESLAQMAELEPDILAPGHTLPLFGKAQIQDALLTTQAAIVHVMTQTAEGMDDGRSPEDIAAGISLPNEISDRPWLKEFYGKLSWSVRAFAAGTLGWYDGNPTNLGTMTSRERANELSTLAGGIEQLMRHASETENLQWRLELCDHLIALDQPAHSLKAETLRKLAEDEINATARNTYLWEAKKLTEHGDAQ